MRKLLFILPILIIILISGCTEETSSPETTEVSERVSFTTSDGFTVVGNYYQSNKNAPVLILLHMLNKDRSTWDNFATLLKGKGYAVLAIDLRGHGESIKKNGQTVFWREFSEQDFNNMVLDVQAAKRFLESKDGVNKEKIGIIGASIGGNIGLKYAASDVDIDVLILLSPGLDYRGVKTENVISEYGDRPILLVAGSGDEYSAQSVGRLNELAENPVLKIYDTDAHGTNMFGTTDLESMIVNWLEENFV